MESWDDQADAMGELVSALDAAKLPPSALLFIAERFRVMASLGSVMLYTSFGSDSEHTFSFKVKNPKPYELPG